MITNIKATNAILLGDKQENEEQRPFKARFLQAGLVKYDFGVCLLKKETIDRFIDTFIDCPVIIDHKDNLTEDDRKGTIKNIWFSPEDGWFWCDGVLSDEAAELVENGYNVSCQYRITEYANNYEHKLHNGNEYDKEILNGIFEHLAIVNTPRYEDAYIAVNAIVIEDKKEEEKDQNSTDKFFTKERLKENKTATNSFTADFYNYAYNILSKEIEKAINGWVTLDETDEDGNRIKVYISGFYGQSEKERNRKAEILSKYKGTSTTYNFEHTRTAVTSEQKNLIKKTVDNYLKEYNSKPIAQVEVRSLEGGALGLCTSGKNASIVGLDSSLFSGKMTKGKWEKSVKEGFHPKTDNKDFMTCVLTHELGHAISVNTENKEFWNEIKNIKSDYVTNIKKDDINNPDFISDYARTNEYEFVAEAFAQGKLSKKYGKYTKRVLDVMDKHLKSQQLKIAATNKQDNDVIVWEEEYGYGYPIDEESYDNFKKSMNE